MTTPGRVLTALALLAAGTILLVSYASILGLAATAFVVIVSGDNLGAAGATARGALRDVGLGFGVMALILSCYIAAGFAVFGGRGGKE